MDVVTAYLNGFLNEEIYMEIPDQLKEILEKVIAGKPVGSSTKIIDDQKILGTARKRLNVLREDNESVNLLKRALYGLKQSGVQWYRRLRDEVLNMGWRPSSHDPCLFHKSEGKKIALITIYVDDILIASTCSF